jgi:predicted amidophosphoribosyltransferase
VEDNSRFCGECGTALQMAIKACSRCHLPLPDNAKFCGECGNPV